MFLSIVQDSRCDIQMHCSILANLDAPIDELSLSLSPSVANKIPDSQHRGHEYCTTVC